MKYAKGTSFSWDGHVVGLLNSIGGVEVTVDSSEVTTHTLATRWKEWAAGNVDAGSVPISGYFDETDTSGQHAMYADAVAGISRTVVITGPGSAYSLTFTAFVTNIKLIGDSPVDNWVPFSATVKVSGAPTLGISASTGMSAVTISDSGIIAPAFAIGTYEYNVNFDTLIDDCTFTPTAAAHTITLTANGAAQTITSGGASSAIDLGAAGDLTNVVISVAETGKAAKTYTFHCVREAT